ncbi:early nodulin-75-like [Corylus avellana]|uniref:early nodulin-75-like n=1 Tax=Corylus avellana TaxID=13451 RepID=UPI001E2226F1|nr:early nodulin-75-like [Corylus avellana]
MSSKYCLVLLLGVVLLSTASLADHHELSKPHSPPKHKPPTPLDHGEKPFPEHKPPLKGKGDKPPPEHKPPHEHHPGRRLLESASFEQNSASLDGKHPKPPPKHKPPTSSLDKEEKPFPELKPPTKPFDEPPKRKGEKPPPEHKPPHDHHPGRRLLELSSLEQQNSASLDGKPQPPKGEKPPPKHKPPTLEDDAPKPKGKGEKPTPEHKPPHNHHPGHPSVEDGKDSHNTPRKLKAPTAPEKKPPSPSHKPPHKPPPAN